MSDSQRDSIRDLTKKITKSRAVFEQYKSGELKVLDANQQRIVDNFERWEEDLVALKRGDVPLHKAAASKAAPTAAPVANRSSVATDAEEATAEAELDPTSIVTRMFWASPKVRKSLLDAHIAAQVDRKKLHALTKEYDVAAGLRRDIASGRISKPTKSQQAKVDAIEGLRRELQLEQESIKLQSDRIRREVLAAVAELDDRKQAEEAGDVEEDEYEEEEYYDEEEAYEEEEDAAEEEEHAVKEETDATSEGHQHANAEAAAHEAHEERAVAPADAVSKDEAPREEEEGEEQPNEIAAQEPAAEEAKDEEPADVSQEEEVAAPVAEEEAERDEEESAADADPKETEEEQGAADVGPEQPAPKKEIDWSLVTIQRNRGRNLSTADESSENRSPSPRSPTTKREDPSKLCQVFGIASTSSRSAVDSGANAKKGGGNKKDSGGNKKGATAAPQNGAGGATISRVTKDLAFCQAHPLPYVAFAAAADDVRTWRVNVAPVDGPLAGCIIPLEMRFPDLYPQEPPLVRSLIEVPHPAIVASDLARFTLCLEHTAKVPFADISAARGWSPTYGAYSVLAQLQTFFNNENFTKLKRATSNFAHRISIARAEAALFLERTQHRPVPHVPFVNGPWEKGPASDDLVADGAGATRPARGVSAGAFWQHGYAGAGCHHVYCAIAKVGANGESGLIGVGQMAGGAASAAESSRKGASPADLGKGDDWGLDLKTGTLFHKGEATEPSSEATAAKLFPLREFDIVDIAIDLDTGKLSFSLLRGGESSVAALIAETAIDNSKVFRPGFYLPAKAAMTLAFPTDGAWSLTNPAWRQPASSVAAADGEGAAAAAAADQDLRCEVTGKGPQEEDVLLGVCVEVARGNGGKDPIPSHIHSSGSIVSVEAFKKVQGQRALSGVSCDQLVPLLLTAKHREKALPALRRTLSMLCRNPQASTLYVSPFRPANAAAVFPLLLADVARDFSVNKSSPLYGDARRALTTYIFFLHGLLALATDAAGGPAIIDALKAAFAKPARGGCEVFALSTVATAQWPDVAQWALQHCLGTGKVFEKDDAAFAILRRHHLLQEVLSAATFARAARSSSLRRLLDSIEESGGHPSPQMLADVEAAVSRHRDVTSWETLCDHLGMNFSATEVCRASVEFN